MRIAWLALLGCSTPYRGELAHAATLGCIDVDVQRASHDGIVLMWRLGNRCERAAAVDLSRARVFAVTADGSRELTAYDPRHEIVVKWLAAGDTGQDAIEYVPAVESTQIIVELAGVDDSPNHARWQIGTP